MSRHLDSVTDPAVGKTVATIRKTVATVSTPTVVTHLLPQSVARITGVPTIRYAPTEEARLAFPRPPTPPPPAFVPGSIPVTPQAQSTGPDQWTHMDTGPADEQSVHDHEQQPIAEQRESNDARECAVLLAGGGDSVHNPLTVVSRTTIPDPRSAPFDCEWRARIAEVGPLLPDNVCVGARRALGPVMPTKQIITTSHVPPDVAAFAGAVHGPATAVRRIGATIQALAPEPEPLPVYLSDIARARVVHVPPPSPHTIHCTAACIACTGHQAHLPYERAFLSMWAAIQVASTRTEGDIGLVCPSVPDPEKFSAKTLGRSAVPTAGHPSLITLVTDSPPRQPPHLCSLWFVMDADLPDPPEWYTRAIIVHRDFDNIFPSLCHVADSFFTE